MNSIIITNATLSNLIRFYPYEQVHATNSIISFDDKDNYWYNIIDNLLKQYKIKEYYNCREGYFNLTIDNKITIELRESIFITYWDNKVYISNRYRSFKDNPIFCTVSNL